MPSLPRTHVLSSTTFTAPPLQDETLALPDLYDFHLARSPKHPLFVYDDTGVLRTITWSEGAHAMHRAAYFVNEVVKSDGETRPAPVVAVLASTDTVTYFCFVVGCLRAGYTVFTISPRNSAQAVAHLLQKTGARYLFVSPEPAITVLYKAALEQIPASYAIDTAKMATFDDLFKPAGSATDFVLFPARSYDMDGPALILHSSGSTAFPKPIIRSHRGLVQLTHIPWYGEVDMCGMRLGCHAVPMFHGMGLLQLALAPSTGLVLAMYKPSIPAVVPTPENAFAAAMATDTELLVCAPMFLEAWSRTPDNIEGLKNLRGIMIGGGPLNKGVGDSLASQGVAIINAYSCTECGQMSMMIPAARAGMDWEYFPFSPHVKPTLLRQQDDPTTFEVVVKSHELLRPMTINTQVDGIDAYATSDLLQQHPTKPHLYKIFGRVDDQIMLSTGEKESQFTSSVTNPGPLETILCQDPKVKAAVIFGRERPFNGVILAPRPEFVFDPKDGEALVAFRDSVWSTIERMNSYAPTHSRLFKETILVESPSKPFLYTAKSTVRRALVISEYSAEIEEMYSSFTVSTVPLPDSWTDDTVKTFVAETVAYAMGRNMDPEADLFQHGCDSLKSTWIQNAIKSAVAKSTSSSLASRIPSSLVYTYPTVAALVNYTSTVINTADLPAGPDDVAAKAAAALETLGRFTLNFPARPTDLRVSQPSGDVIMLIGSTGGLGSCLLYHLATSPRVDRVYALNRKSPTGETLLERQKRSLRWADVDILGGGKVVLLEADVSDSVFSLSPSVFEEMHSSVTHIIHNAWRVDFNSALLSFEANIRSVRNLVDFSLSSPLQDPSRLLFISSVAVFNRPKSRGICLEKSVEDPSIPVGTGYGEAKWIGEQILMKAAAETDLKPTVVRLGQIAHTPDGYWNEREWFPLIIKSAQSINCLPDLPGAVSWFSAFGGAKAITEMLYGDRPFLHLAHPRPTAWSTIMKEFAKHLNVSVVPYTEWLSALATDLKKSPNGISQIEHMRRNPALKLLEFYSDADLDEDREPLGIVRLGIDEALHVSKTLAEMKPLDGDCVSGWLSAWNKSGFIVV